MEKIDFVLLWVDGNDPKWLKEKEKYKSTVKKSDNNTANRYRDWDNLQYWFRSIEKNAKWVNNIYFVTWGHLPSWLNTNHPKLKIVKHEDFIPKEYLPTYNSNVIQFYLHKIKGLSEYFVLFDDDMLIIKETKKEDFFKNGIPRECYSERILYSNNPNDVFTHALLNNMCIINKYFNKYKVYKKKIFKYFNYRYGLKDNLCTLMLLPFPSFSNFDTKHVAVSLCKSTIEKIWELEEENCKTCSNNKFRFYSDITQYVFRYYQLVTGNFIPRNSKFGMYICLKNDNTNLLKKIDKSKAKLACFNDTEAVTDFENSKNTLNSYLESKFPKKSEYEL